ncbi:MAG TPA: hypothetical protein GYA10_03665 [Alphaproteobacteria bacterium]|nr:hypothetical protein [Alphaproteobacteria bacterium]
MGGWFILLAVLAVMLILGALVVVAVRPRGGRDADTAAGYFVTDHRRRDDGDARSDGDDDAEGEGD